MLPTLMGLLGKQQRLSEQSWKSSEAAIGVSQRDAASSSSVPSDSWNERCFFFFFFASQRTDQRLFALLPPHLLTK